MGLDWTPPGLARPRLTATPTACADAAIIQERGHLHAPRWACSQTVGGYRKSFNTEPGWTSRMQLHGFAYRRLTSVTAKPGRRVV